MTSLLLIAVLGLAMALTLAYVAEDPLDPLTLFTVAYAPLFVLRPAFLALGLDEPIDGFLLRRDPEPLQRQAVLAFALSYVCFVGAYILSRGRSARTVAALLPGFRASGFSARRLSLVVLAGVLASTVMSLYFMARLGTARDYMHGTRHGLFAGLSFLGRIPIVTSFAAALLLHWSLVHRRGLATALILFVTSLLGILAMGDRSGVLFAFVVVVVCYHFETKRVPLHRFALWGVALVALLVAMGIIRRAVLMEGAGAYSEAFATAARLQGEVLADTLTRHLNLSGFDRFVVILQEFDASNLHYGEDYLRGLYGVIPRSLWEDKPANITVGTWYRDTFLGDSSTSGKPITSIGTLWLNFGYVGALVGGAIAGAMGRVSWEYVTSARSPAWAGIFYVTFQFNLTSFGVITIVTPIAIVLSLVPMLAVYALCRDDGRVSASAAPSSSLHGPLPSARERFQ